MSLAQASCTLAYLPGSAAYLLSVTGCDCQCGSGNYATLVVWQAKKLLQIPQATASGNKVISSWKAFFSKPGHTTRVPQLHLLTVASPVRMNESTALATYVRRRIHDRLNLRYTFPRVHEFAELGKMPGSQRCMTLCMQLT